MGSNTRKKILILLAIIWALLIFCLSNATSKKSGSDSANIIMNCITVTLKVTNKTGITNYHPDEVELKSIIRKINDPLREVMHAVVYFILALLLIYVLGIYGVKKKYLITLIVCLLYALSDEFHQIFVKGRTWELLDLLLDTIGILLACGLMKLINKKDYHS